MQWALRTVSVPFLVLRFATILLVTLLCLYHAASQCWVYERSNASSPMPAISMISPATGVALGWFNCVYTTDGGVTWNPRHVPTDQPLRSISCVNESTWFVGVQGGLLRSMDRGLHWESHSISPMASAVCFFDSLRGFVVGYEWGVIQRTTDGGITWVVQNFSHDGMFLYAGAFPDFLHGTVVGITGGQFGLIMHTSDGGDHWITQRREPYEYLFAVCFLNPDTGYAVGQAAVRTTDGGTTWSSLITPVATNLNGVSFADLRHGVIVGEVWGGSAYSGIILETSDGGTTWDTTKVPGTPLQAVSCLDGGTCIAVGDGGTILRKITDCSSALQISLGSPANGMAFQPIVPIDTLRSAMRFTWDFSPHRIAFTQSRFQLSADSGFAGGFVTDTLVPILGSQYNTALVVGNLVPGQKYHWRVGVVEYDGTVAGWSAGATFTTSRSTISGLLFEDLDGDSVRGANELAIPNWPVRIGGKIQTTILTNSLGEYSITGLDSGMYVVSETPSIGASVTCPPAGYHTVMAGVNDTVSRRDFGNYFPWNNVSGVVFIDGNENGVRDSNDAGIAHVKVVIDGKNTRPDTVLTDSLGGYLFRRVDLLESTVSVILQPPLEQIYPQLQAGYSVTPYQFNQRYGGRDFAIHHMPLRVKLILNVSDNTTFAHRDIWWGIRPEATYGIWGVSPNGTTADFSEGEFEIPPPSYGLFDARFVDPRNTWRDFGAGSWTDMRGVEFLGKPDTFLVTFAPGVLYGGGYPMRFRWSKEDVASSFDGSVQVVLPWGTRMDMKTFDSLSLPGTGYDYFLIIAENPAIPNLGSYLKVWHMVSLPEAVPDGSVKKLFRTALSRAYRYSASTGYVPCDTLVPGAGYWLKYAPGLDTLPMDAALRLRDTVHLAEGWNIAGALSIPVDVTTLVTDPPGIIGADIYCFDGSSYVDADTLKPSKAYWVKAIHEGDLILGATGVNSRTALARTTREILQKSSLLGVRDAEGGEAALYFRLRESTEKDDLSRYELPPIPPEESFDVRFASNRFLEEIGGGERGEYSIRIASAAYPVRIQWKESALRSAQVTASLLIGASETPLRGDGSVSILSPHDPVKLKLLGSPDLPTDFLLGNNYPNPFNPVTTIPYALPAASQVKIGIYTMLGQIVETLVDEVQAGGYKTVQWNGAAFASGLYFYRMEARSIAGPGNRFVRVKKLMLVK
jgi:photosystem II stability/assembly factor-like uncharacterized protein